MAHFGKTLRRSTLSMHILFSALWVGAAISMITLFFTKIPQNISEVLAYNLALKLIDDWVIIGSATISFLTGILLSWKTSWGFFKHWWVATKLILTFALIILGSFWLGKWTNESVYMVQESGIKALSNPVYIEYQEQLKLWGSLQFGVLVFLIVISVFKPWKKIKQSR